MLFQTVHGDGVNFSGCSEKRVAPAAGRGAALQPCRGELGGGGAEGRGSRLLQAVWADVSVWYGKGA